MMASYEFFADRSKARIWFRYGGQRYGPYVRADSERAAARVAAVVEETIDHLKRGLLSIPEGVDVGRFLVNGGKAPATFFRTAAQEVLNPTLNELVALYKATPPSHLEPSTQEMIRIHLRRLQEHLGNATLTRPQSDSDQPADALDALDRVGVQGYVRARSRQKYKGKKIQRKTIRMEVQTLRQVWSWVASQQGPQFPRPEWNTADLSYPKAKEPPPFMSWSEIEREIAQGDLSEDERNELWDALWLDRAQVRELLEFVKAQPAAAWVYPAFTFAAYTGIRRSELCRSRTMDWRFESDTLKVRQKKRDRDKEFSFRSIPIHPELRECIKAWLTRHPGGPLLLCRQDKSEISWREASRHFNRVLKNSKWQVLKGWHVLRHSFASNLAAAGVDQRKIDAWMGHSTDIRLRYQHLRPEDQQNAIAVL